MKNQSGINFPHLLSVINFPHLLSVFLEAGNPKVAIFIFFQLI